MPSCGVRLGVCLSRTFAFSDRKKGKIFSNFFRRLVDPPFQFLHSKRYGNIPTGTPLTGAKIAIFDQRLALGSVTGAASSVVNNFDRGLNL